MKLSNTEQLFDRLDQYKQFCVDNGYPFNEADLGRNNSPWGHMQKSIANKRRPYNQWIRDGKAMRSQGRVVRK
jgi:hypothetical protein